MKTFRRWAGLSLTAAWLTWSQPAKAGTVALWLCDELSGTGAARVLEDRGPLGCHVSLAPGAALIPGRFGQAVRFRAIADRDGSISPPAPRTPPSHAFSRRATASRLNLGAQDWTIECWLRLDPDAANEAVIFEMCVGSSGVDEEVTRFSILPRENAFLLTGLAPVAPGDTTVLGRVREIADPGGPPGISVQSRSVTLALADAVLPRAKWFHVALVHRAAMREARVFLDGRSRAVATVHLTGLPPGDAAIVSLGGNARGGSVLPGAIDELRISDHAVYTGEFNVPGSFASAPVENR